MGFSNGECYICYGQEYGNNNADYMIKICFGCFEYEIMRYNNWKEYGLGKMPFYILEENNYIDTCECHYCKKEKPFVIDITVCNRHYEVSKNKN